MTYIYDNTSRQPHLPLTSAIHTFGHTPVTHPIIVHSGDNPAMALLPETGRRPTSFKQTKTVILRCCLQVSVVGSGAAGPASHLQSELVAHTLASPAVRSHSVQPLPFQPSAGILGLPETPAHIPRARGSQGPCSE